MRFSIDYGVLDGNRYERPTTSHFTRNLLRPFPHPGTVPKLGLCKIIE